MNSDQEQKLQDKVYRLDDDENNAVYEILEKAGVFTEGKHDFNSKFFAFNLLSVPGT